MPSSTTPKFEFDDATIQALFGHEAAEQDDIVRLRQYYFKGQTFKRVVADLPLRILVGQKGSGKSALLSVARSEDLESGESVLSLRPEDFQGIGDGTGDFIKQITDWRKAITSVIQEHIFEHMGVAEEKLNSATWAAGQFITFLKNSAKPFLDKYIDQTPLQKAVSETFYKANRITVYIDDLDRGWENKREHIRRLAAFFIAIKDLTIDEPGIRFRVAIRSDVFYAIRKSEPDTDKLESSIVWHSWTNHEVLLVLVKRVLRFHGKVIDEAVLLKQSQPELAQHLLPVMTMTYLGQGLWERLPIHRFLMSMVRQRPRDIVKLCSAAARRADEQGHSVILTSDFSEILEAYSAERIQDVSNEHGLELPDLNRLLFGMKPNRRTKKTSLGYLYKTDKLLEKLSGILSQGALTFATGQKADAKSLADFLYKVDFLIARKDTPKGISRKYFDQSRYLSSTFVDFGYDWEVHLAYRWALQPEDIMDILSESTPEPE